MDTTNETNGNDKKDEKYEEFLANEVESQSYLDGTTKEGYVY